MAESILVQADADVTDVLARLRDHSEREIRLVVPAGSALGASRFNFQLLAGQVEEAGQQLVVESDDERVLEFATAAGLAAHSLGRVAAGAPLVPAPGGVPPFEEVADDADDGADEEEYGTPGGSRRAPRPYQPRYGPWRPEQMARPASRPRLPRPASRRRVALYGAAAAILLIGIVAVVVLVPSATITLMVSARPFSTAVDLTAQPGAPAAGITVRTQTAQKQLSGSFQATGQKNTPGAKASGTIQYQDGCTLGLVISKGAVVTSQSGVQFVQQQAVTVDAGKTQTAPIQAQSEGANGNVAAGQITSLQNAGTYASCLKVTNPQPTTGGKDAKHQPLITQQDLAAAKAQLQQQAEQAIQSQLSNDVRPGEKQSDQNPVTFGTPEFTPDHAAGSLVQHFNATLTLKGTSAYYRPAQVSSAFRTVLRSKVPAGRQLTPDNFVAQYETTAAAGGRLEFKGQATGRTAPRLDLAAIRSQLAGRSMGSAESYLRGLPVQSVEITQYPFPFPVLPLLKSRISVEYVIQQPAVPAPSPGTTAGAGIH